MDYRKNWPESRAVSKQCLAGMEEERRALGFFRRNIQMSDRESKVLGYIAMVPGTINVICDGKSCVVAGSEKLMQRYISVFSSDRDLHYEIKKARYGQVIQAMKLGGVYSFDEESYSRFFPLAQEEGIRLVDFTPDSRCKPDGSAIHLMQVRWIPR